MDKLKIFVCCHKPTEVKLDDVYIPLHVGRALSKHKEEMAWMIGDDTGDNISEKNPYYCEATGIYWIWKNVQDCEYVGLCHYRRYFDYNFTNQNIDSLFKNGTKVILTKKAPISMPRYALLCWNIQTEHYFILRGIIKKIYPDYIPTFNVLSKHYFSHLFNMVLCRKELYDKYAEFVFNICFEFEKYYRPSSFSNPQRAIGYIVEFLTPLFFIHNNYKIKELGMLFNGAPWNHSVLVKLKYKLMDFINNIHNNKRPISTDSSIIAGLKRDGIDLDLD